MKKQKLFKKTKPFFSSLKNKNYKLMFFFTLRSFSILLIGCLLVQNIRAQTPGGVTDLNYSWVAWLTPESGYNRVSNTNATWVNNFTTAQHPLSVGNFTSPSSNNDRGSSAPNAPYIRNINERNFHPAIEFRKGGQTDGSNDEDRLAAALPYNFSEKSVTAMFVYRRTNTAQYNNLFTFNVNNDNNLAWQNNGSSALSWHGSGSNNGVIANAYEGMITLTNTNQNATTSNSFLNGAVDVASRNLNVRTSNIRPAIATNGSSGYGFSGYIQEIIIFSSGASGSNPTASDLQPIHSYLAVKYGFVLNNMLNWIIDGDTIWNKTLNNGYNHNIFGIARSDHSRLYQKQSQSQNSNILTLFLGDTLEELNSQNTETLPDGQFLMLGSNNSVGNTLYEHLAGTSFSNGSIDEKINFHTSLMYKAQITGTGSQTVSMQIDLPNLRYVIVSPNPMFPSGLENGARVYPVTGKIAHNVWINDGDYISFAGFEPRPGGIDMTGYLLDLWIDGNNSSNSSWTNLANSNFSLEKFSTNAPEIRDSRYNFNRELNFGNVTSSKLRTTDTYGLTSGQSYHIFVVSDATTGTLNSNNVLFTFGQATGNTSMRWHSSTSNILSANWSTTQRSPNFSETNYPRYGISALNLVNSNSSQNNTIHLNGATYSFSLGTSTAEGASTANNRVLIGNASNDTGTGSTDPFNGSIQEIIMIRRPAGALMSSTDIEKIQSYLAIKYGFTLPGNYRNSDGDIVWNLDPVYNQNIFGIGRDDNSGLYQKQSQSEKFRYLSIYLGNALESLNAQNNAAILDKEYLMLGANNASGNVSFIYPEGTLFSNDAIRNKLNYRTARVYKTQTTGVPSQTVNMKIELEDAGFMQLHYVLVSPSALFDTLDTRIYPVTDRYADNILIHDGDYIAFAGYEPRPGGIDMSGYSLDLWIDGNHSTNSLWRNLAYSNFTLEKFSTNTPTVQNSRFNFNRELNFSVTSSKLRTTETYGLTAGQSYHIFVVSDATKGVLNSNNVLYTFGQATGTTSMRWHSSATNILTANWNTTQRSPNFSAVNNSRYGITTLNLVNANSSQDNAIYLNGAIYNFNLGTSTAEGASTVNNRLLIGNANTGTGTESSDPFNGNMQEIIMIRKPLGALMTNTEIEQIHSYLAIKYGITLPHHYRNSDGDIVWEVDTTYNQNIFGIGRDDNSGLYQKQSQSEKFRYMTLFLGNAKTTLNVDNSGTLKDKQYLMAGSNNIQPILPMDKNLFEEGDIFVNGVIQTSTGFNIQSPTFKTQLTNLDSIVVKLEAPSDEFLYLLVSKNDDFDLPNTKIYTIIKRITDQVTFDQEYKYFKFIGLEPGPGGVFIGLKLWLRADNEASLTVSEIPHSSTGLGNSGNTAYPNKYRFDTENIPVVEEWKDLARTHIYKALPSGPGAVNGERYPVYHTNKAEMNYHPTVEFWSYGNNNGSDNNVSGFLGNNTSSIFSTETTPNHTAILLTNNDFSTNAWVFPLSFGSATANGNYDGPAYGVEQSGNNVVGRYRINSSNVINGNTHLFNAGATSIMMFNHNTSATPHTITFRVNGRRETVNNNTIGGSHRLNANSKIGSPFYEVNRTIQGFMSEVIMYDALTMSAQDLNKIESYLAIKYSITLYPPIAAGVSNYGRYNYQFSDGTTIWAGDYDIIDPVNGKYATFYNNVAAVIRDDMAKLNNSHSHSTNVGSLLHLGVAGTALSEDGSDVGYLENDLEAIVFGNTNATTITTIPDSDPCGDFEHRFDRIWLVRKITKNNRPITMLVGAQNNANLTIGNDLQVQTNYYNKLTPGYNICLLVADSPTDITAGNYKAVIPLSMINGEYQCSYIFTEEDTYLTFGYKSNGKGCFSEVGFNGTKSFQWTQYNSNTNLSTLGGLTIPSTPFPAVDLGDDIQVTETKVVYEGGAIGPRANRGYPRSVNSPARGSLEMRRTYGQLFHEVTTTINFNHPVIPEFSITGLDGRNQSRDRVEISGECSGATYYPELYYGPTPNSKATYVIKGNVAEVNKNTSLSASNVNGKLNVAFGGGVTSVQIKWRLTNRINGTQSIFISPIAMTADPPPPPINEDGLSFTQQATPQEVTVCNRVTYTWRVQNTNCEHKKVNFSVTLPEGMKWFNHSLSVDSANMDLQTVINNYVDHSTLTIDSLLVRGASMATFRAQAYFDLNAMEGAYSNQALIQYKRIINNVNTPVTFESCDRFLPNCEPTSVIALPGNRMEPLTIVDFNSDKECFSVNDTVTVTIGIENPNISGTISGAGLEIIYNEEFKYVPESLETYPEISENSSIVLGDPLFFDPNIPLEEQIEMGWFELGGITGFDIPEGKHTITFKLVAPNILQHDLLPDGSPMYDRCSGLVPAPLNLGFSFYSLLGEDQCADAIFWDAFGDTIVNALPAAYILDNRTQVCVDDQAQLSHCENGTWISNDPDIAVVDENGAITAISEGKATFIFVSQNGCMLLCADTLTVELQTVSGPKRVKIGSSITMLPNSGGLWVSSDPHIATITNNGLVTGISEGSVTFTFTNSQTGCAATTDEVLVVDCADLEILPPFVITPAVLCSNGNQLTVADLKDFVDASEIIWYASATGDDILDETTVVNDNDTFWVTQVIGDCESEERSSLTIVINPISTGSMIFANDTTICSGKSATLKVSATSITHPVFKWYSDSTTIVPFKIGDQYLTTILSADTTFYVSVGGDNYCEGEANAIGRKAVIVKVQECKTVIGTVFPFVYWNYLAFDTLFTITANLKQIPKHFSNAITEKLLSAKVVHSTKAIYYDGTIFVPNSPKHPGVVGAINNFGVQINWFDAIGIQAVAPITPTLFEYEVPNISNGQTLGLFLIEDVLEGDYILELQREGFVTRWSKINVSAENPIQYLEHREIIAGDINLDHQIDIIDVNELKTKMGGNFAIPDSFYSPKYDLNADGLIDLLDLNLIIQLSNFKFNNYQETLEWLEELDSEP